MGFWGPIRLGREESSKVDQRLGNLFYKRPGHRYCHLLRPYCLTCDYAILPLHPESSHKQDMNKCVWLCSKNTLFTRQGSCRILPIAVISQLQSRWEGTVMLVERKQAHHGSTETWRRCFKMERIVHQVKLSKMESQNKRFPAARVYVTVSLCKCGWIKDLVIGIVSWITWVGPVWPQGPVTRWIVSLRIHMVNS